MIADIEDTRDNVSVLAYLGTELAHQREQLPPTHVASAARGYASNHGNSGPSAPRVADTQKSGSRAPCNERCARGPRESLIRERAHRRKRFAMIRGGAPTTSDGHERAPFSARPGATLGRR